MGATQPQPLPPCPNEACEDGRITTVCCRAAEYGFPCSCRGPMVRRDDCPTCHGDGVLYEMQCAGCSEWFVSEDPELHICNSEHAVCIACLRDEAEDHASGCDFVADAGDTECDRLREAAGGGR